MYPSAHVLAAPSGQHTTQTSHSASQAASRPPYAAAATAAPAMHCEQQAPKQTPPHAASSSFPWAGTHPPLPLPHRPEIPPSYAGNPYGRWFRSCLGVPVRPHCRNTVGLYGPHRGAPTPPQHQHRCSNPHHPTLPLRYQSCLDHPHTAAVVAAAGEDGDGGVRTLLLLLLLDRSRLLLPHPHIRHCAPAALAARGLLVGQRGCSCPVLGRQQQQQQQQRGGEAARCRCCGPCVWLLQRQWWQQLCGCDSSWGHRLQHIAVPHTAANTTQQNCEFAGLHRVGCEGSTVESSDVEVKATVQSHSVGVQWSTVQPRGIGYLEVLGMKNVGYSLVLWKVNRRLGSTSRTWGFIFRHAIATAILKVLLTPGPPSPTLLAMPLLPPLW